MSTETPVTAPVLEIPAIDHAAELATIKDQLATLHAQLAELSDAKPPAPAPAPVPATDTPPPAITPKTPDTSALPVYARLAAGYSK